MKTVYLTLIAAILAGATLLGVAHSWQSGGRQSSVPENVGASSAAFRDGMYLGKLAAQRGEPAHLASGRWTTADRSAFIAGYGRGYAENLQNSGNATPAGFRDGLYLGKLDAANGREQHIASGRWSRDEDRSSFTEGYRQAYGATLAAMQSQQPQGLTLSARLQSGQPDAK